MTNLKSQIHELLKSGMSVEVCAVALGIEVAQVKAVKKSELQEQGIRVDVTNVRGGVRARQWLK